MKIINPWNSMRTPPHQGLSEARRGSAVFTNMLRDTDPPRGVLQGLRRSSQIIMRIKYSIFSHLFNLISWENPHTIFLSSFFWAAARNAFTPAVVAFPRER